MACKQFLVLVAAASICSSSLRTIIIKASRTWPCSPYPPPPFASSSSPIHPPRHGSKMSHEPDAPCATRQCPFASPCLPCMWHASSMQHARVHGKCPVLQVTCACAAKCISRKIEQLTRVIQKRTKRRLFKKNKKAY